MLRGVIRGNIVSTRKQDSLVGSKFMEVEIMKNGARGAALPPLVLFKAHWILSIFQNDILITGLCPLFFTNNFLYLLDKVRAV